MREPNIAYTGLYKKKWPIAVNVIIEPYLRLLDYQTGFYTGMLGLTKKNERFMTTAGNWSRPNINGE